MNVRENVLFVFSQFLDTFLLSVIFCGYSLSLSGCSFRKWVRILLFYLFFRLQLLKNILIWPLIRGSWDCQSIAETNKCSMSCCDMAWCVGHAMLGENNFIFSLFLGNFLLSVFFKSLNGLVCWIFWDWANIFWFCLFFRLQFMRTFLKMALDLRVWENCCFQCLKKGGYLDLPGCYFWNLVWIFLA